MNWGISGQDPEMAAGGSAALSQHPYVTWPGTVAGNRLSDHLIVQIYSSRQQVGWHAHHFYELVLINKGSSIHQFRGKSEVLIPGDCFLIPLTEPHAYSIPGETEIINCLFYPSALAAFQLELPTMPEIKHLLDPGDDWHTVHLPPAGLAFVRQLLEKMIGRPASSALSASSDLSTLSAQADRHCLMLLLLELAGQFVRQSGQQVGETAEREPPVQADGRALIGRMLAYMQEHYQRTITVRELAATVHLSEGHCRRLFVRFTGYPPLAFLNRLRLQCALQLLEKGGLTITEIADQVGFSDAGYFTRLFKRQMMAPPRDFLA